MRLNNFVISTVTASLFCFSEITLCDPFQGFYIGGELGGTSTIANQNRIVDTLVNVGLLPGPESELIFQNSLNGPKSLKVGNSFKGALYAGWGSRIYQLYLGGEIFADWANYRNHDDFQEVENSEEPGRDLNVNLNTHTRLSKVQFGADFRPGYLIAPRTMLYGRVGGAFAQRTLGIADSIHIVTTDLNGELLTDTTFDLFAENDEHRIVLRLGGGLETHIYPKWNIRMDYIYTYYGHLSVGDFDMRSAIFQGEFFADISAKSLVTTRIYNNTVMLGLTYLIT